MEEAVIEAKLPLGSFDPCHVIARWHSARERCLYRRAALWKYETYALYHVLCRRNDSIDKNGLPDLQIILYLNDVDIMVSNDWHFMKTAFRALWERRGKRFMSSREFSEFIQLHG